MSCTGWDPNLPAAAPPGPFQCQNVKNDVESDLYIPNSNMPTLQFKVNYVFFEHPTIPTVFSGNTIASLTADCQSALSYMNWILQQMANSSSNITPLYPSPPVTDTKIQFVLNNVYKFTTPAAVAPISTGSYFWDNYKVDTADAVTIYFYADPVSNGYGWASYGRYVTMALHPSHPQHIPGSSADLGDGLILHELCHAFGFLNDLYNGKTPPISAWNVDPLSRLGYSPDDATFDPPSYDCDLPFNSVSNPKNNNLMANSMCRGYISARQLASFHYLVARNVTKKFTQFKNTNYPYTPPMPAPVVLTGVQNINRTPPVFSTLTIASGAKIIIDNSAMRSWPGGKIIVEPGAKLTLYCTDVKPIGEINFNGANAWKMWKGIEVRGYGFIPQSINSITGLDNKHGILYLEKCVISRAEDAVLTGAKISSWNYNYWSGGGIVTILNSVFEDNWRCLKMLRSDIGGNSDLSYLNGNTFESSLSANTWWGLINTRMVELEGVKGLRLVHNTFHGGSSDFPFDTLFCIKGSNSSIKTLYGNWTIGGNLFDGSDYGIYLENSYGNIIDKNKVFTRNGIYLHNSSYDKIVNNNVKLDYTPSMPQYSSSRTGLYLDECSNY